MGKNDQRKNFPTYKGLKKNQVKIKTLSQKGERFLYIRKNKFPYFTSSKSTSSTESSVEALGSACALSAAG